MQSKLADLEGRGIGVAAISVDEVKAGRALTDKLKLGFPILSDPGGAAIKAFGVFDDGTEIAWPSIFVVARDGTVIHRWLADTFRQRVATEDVMKELEKK